MESLSAFAADHFTLPMAWPWAVGVALLVIGFLEIVYRLMFRWLTTLAGLTTTTLDDVLVRRMRLPAQVLVFLLGTHVFLALRDVENASVSKAVTITELLLMAYLVIEATETAVLHYWLGERKKIVVPNVVRHLLLVVVYTVAVLSIIGTVTGVNVAPLLATSTVITVVLGLALQDTLGNLFAGLSLSLEQPFKTGEWILIDGIEGRVEHMGWRATHLRTFTWDIVVIPNSVIGKARLQNFDRPLKTTGRNLEVFLPLHATPADLEVVVEAAMKQVPRVLITPAPKLWFIAMTPLYHRYIVRFWLEDFAAHDDVESDFLKAIFTELASRNLALTAGTAAGVDVDGKLSAIVSPTIRPTPSSQPPPTEPG